MEHGCVLVCQIKAECLSIKEVATVSSTESTTETSEKEIADLIANLDTNVNFQQYGNIDNGLSIVVENLHVSNFIHRNIIEALVLS